MKQLHLVLVALSALLFSASPARAEWWEATTDHFVVYSESSQADARKFAADLDRFDGALRTLQGMPVQGDVGRANKVTVFRSGEPSDVGKLAGGGSVYGFYLPRAGRPVAFAPARDEMQRGSRHYESRAAALNRSVVLNHEYTHHFMLMNFPATYPGWYVEGFAELMATIELRDDGTFHVGNPPQHRAYEVFQMSLIPLERLLDSSYRLRGEKWIQQYGQGWLVAHYLSFSKERDGQLNAYLKAIGTGEASLPAARRIFGDLGKLDRELAKYLKGPLPGINVKPGSYVPPQVTMRRLAKEEERLMRSRMLLSRGVTRKDGADVLSSLKALGDWTAGHPQAQLAIAEAALDAGLFAEASGAADRAIALDPASTEALILKARSLFESGDNDGLGGKERFAESRALLAKARKLDERNPEPLILYYKSFTYSREPLTSQARMALETAYASAAFDFDFRLLLGRQLLDEDRLADARTVLLPISFRAHAEDPEKEPMAKVASALEAGDITAARAAIAEMFKKQEEARNKK